MERSMPPGAHGTGTYNTIGTGTGWSAMARIVREIDEQKIQNYKDDIDTILVFAGLFSAVMTAFLVESYHNLSQDPTQVMVLLMQQLTMQTYSYTMNGGFLNSTAPPPPVIPEFTPTVNAIRVNVLWFASLTLSLVSASFSILVKQWLQEYLSGEFTSPQARIRIRHFRYPGLDDWKVFEIAAALPLLLQLSLALFFVGLCFFTADVHSTVGHTTLPLVLAWAFLFLVVSLAPALSPRCPYKTRLLKSTMQALRKEILRIIMWVKDISLKDITPLPEISSKWSYQLLAYNEADAAGTDAKDVDIFISVDSIQTDEQLLRAMWDALHQTTPQLHETYAFIAKAVEHRSPSGRAIPAISDSNAGQNLDLKSIPKQMAPFILTITSEILRKELDRRLSSTALEPRAEWSPEMKGCLYLLLSETDADTPEAVHQLFLFILDDQVRRMALFQAFTSLAMPPDSFSRVFARLQPAITRVNGDNLLEILASLMQSFFCSSSEHSHAALIDVVKDHLDHNSSQHFSVMVKLVISLMKKAILSAEKTNPAWQAVAKIFLFQLYDLDTATLDLCRADIVEFVRFFLLRWRYVATIFNPMFSMYHTYYEQIRESVREASIQAAVTSSPSELAEILHSFRVYAFPNTNRSVFSEDKSTPGHWDRSDPLHASLVFLRLLQALRENGTSLEEHANVIRGFFTAIEEGLETVAGMRQLWKKDYPDSAKLCLKLVKGLDISEPPADQDHETFSQWAENFPVEDSLFPDTFIEKIALYLSDREEEVMTSHRLRRLRLSKANESVATSDESSSESDDTSDESNDSDDESVDPSNELEPDGATPFLTPNSPIPSHTSSESRHPYLESIAQSHVHSPNIESPIVEPQVSGQMPASESVAEDFLSMPQELSVDSPGSRVEAEHTQDDNGTLDDGSNVVKEDLSCACSAAETRSQTSQGSVDLNDVPTSVLGGQGGSNDVSFAVPGTMPVAVVGGGEGLGGTECEVVAVVEDGTGLGGTERNRDVDLLNGSRPPSDGDGLCGFADTDDP